MTSSLNEALGRVKIDWLNLVFPAGQDDQREKVKGLVNGRLGAGQDTERGLHFYKHVHQWESGAMLAWSEDLGHMLLSLNGDSLDYFPADHLHPLLKAAEDLGAHCTRIDLAYDDLTRQLVRMEDVHAAAAAGNFCGFRTEGIQLERRSGVATGDGHYFGKKGKAGSGRMVLFYDKALESRGEINATRIEARFFKEHAALIFEALASALSVESMERKIRNHIGGAIDFRERGTHKHVARMPRLDWWQKVLDALGTMAVRVERAKPPLQAAMEYCRDTWAASFAITWEIAESQGQDADALMCALMREMVERGRERASYTRPGSRALGLDFAELLAGQRRRTA